MRQLYLPLGVLLFLASWTSPAAAQSLAQWAAPGPAPAPPTSVNATPPAELAPVTDPYDKSWVVDAVLGLPTGVRVQHNLGDGVGRDWLVEGLVGFELFFPMVGVGLRRRLTVVCGEHDAFRVNPGVDAYLLLNTLRYDHDWYSGGPATIKLFTADVDLLWEHAFNDQCAAQVGLKLGGGFGYGNRWGFLPVVGVVLGCRF